MAKLKNHNNKTIQLNYLLDSVQIQPLATVVVDDCFVSDDCLPSGLEWLDRPQPIQKVEIKDSPKKIEVEKNG
jgi:hypothetical protein